MWGCRELISLPENFGNLVNLKELHMGGCVSLEILPESFGNLQSLTKIVFPDGLKSLPDSFGNLKSLEKSLSISNLSELESLGRDFGNLDHIQKLYIRNCLKLTSFPNSFGGLSSLELLSLEYCTQLAALPHTFGNLKSLKKLHLNSNSALQNLPDSFGNLPVLEELHLDQCLELISLSGDFGKLENLKSLKITRCPKLAKLPESFGELKNLEIITIQGCDNLSELSIGFGGLEKLSKIVISDCQSISTLPESFGQLTGLKQMIIQGCSKFIDLSPGFGGCKGLRKLDLSNNASLSSLSESIGEITKLKSLNLSSCNFETIPTGIWPLSGLSSLNLSNNPLNEEETNLATKIPEIILGYLKDKASIKVLISHAVVDFDSYQIEKMARSLEKHSEISEAFFCEEDLTGNIDEWMLNTIPKCHLVLFVATQKSVFNSADCMNELDLADQHSIPVIPIKGRDLDWADLAKLKLARELGMEFPDTSVELFFEMIYKYIHEFKRNMDLFSKDSRFEGMANIYGRFEIKHNEIEKRISKIEHMLEEILQKINQS